MKMKAYIVLSLRELRELARVAARDAKIARGKDNPGAYCVVLSGSLNDCGKAPAEYQLSSTDLMDSFRAGRIEKL